MGLKGLVEQPWTLLKARQAGVGLSSDGKFVHTYRVILLVPWLHILKHCYQQEFACKHTKILLVDILVPVFRPHFTVCNPLSNINTGHVCTGSADGLHLVQ